MLDFCLNKSAVNPVPAYINQTTTIFLCCPCLFLSFSLFQLVDEEKSLVMTEMEKVVALCQQLQMGAKTPVQGKTATFQKVPILRLCVCQYVYIYLFLLMCSVLHKMNRYRFYR